MQCTGCRLPWILLLRSQIGGLLSRTVPAFCSFQSYVCHVVKYDFASNSNAYGSCTARFAGCGVEFRQASRTMPTSGELTIPIRNAYGMITRIAAPVAPKTYHNANIGRVILHSCQSRLRREIQTSLYFSSSIYYFVHSVLDSYKKPISNMMVSLALIDSRTLG